MVRALFLEAWAFFSFTSAIIIQDRGFRNFKKIWGRTELFASPPSPARAWYRSGFVATEYHSPSTVRSWSRLSSTSVDGDWDAYAGSAAEYTYSLRIVNSLAEVDRGEWSSLVSSVFPDERSREKSLEESTLSMEPLNAANPFLQYEWLNLLETTGCASVRMGWQPIHLLIYRSAAIVVGADNLNDYLGSNDNVSTDSEKQSGDDFATTQPTENSTDVDMVRGVGSSTAGAGETSTASSSYAERYQIASVVERPTRLIGAMPLYAKYHSQGEFIFDQSWASFAESRLSVQYYPKLLGAVPFTPAAGPRILLNPQLSDLTASAAAGEEEGVRQHSREVLESTESKHRAQILRLVARFLQSFAIENKLSSANVNFLSSEAEIAAFKDVDYDVRETIQYRWQNLNKVEGRRYESFEDYLSCFKSKRRIKIRAERKKVYEHEGITVRVIRGDDDVALGLPEEREAFFVQMHRLYTTTIEKMWGSEYLNEQFFRALSQTPASFRKHLVFIVAYDTSGSRRSDNLKYNKFRDRNSGGSSVGGPSIERLIELFGGKPKDFEILADSAESNESKDSSSTSSSNSSRSSESSKKDEFSLENIVAGTINLVSRSHFYGRYWGTYSYVPNLHFEVCYYRAIEFCIEQGVDYLEPGAGGGEFKFLRGFDPYTVYSVHWFQNKILRAAVAQFLEQERDLNQEQKEYLIENSRVSSSSTTTTSSSSGQPPSSPPASPSDSK